MSYDRAEKAPKHVGNVYATVCDEFKMKGKRKWKLCVTDM